MNWHQHYELRGKHSLLSPSQYRWIDIPSDNPHEYLFKKYAAYYATDIGTLVHEYAEKKIRFGQRMDKRSQDDLIFYLLDHKIPETVIDIGYMYDNVRNYVNDALGCRMSPEVVLRYSDNCFGTADAISYRKDELRVHDLKTGKTPAHMEQLLIYAALFFLEYQEVSLEKTSVELRIYQANDILITNPTTEEVKEYMNQIVAMSQAMNEVKTGEWLINV